MAVSRSPMRILVPTLHHINIFIVFFVPLAASCFTGDNLANFDPGQLVYSPFKPYWTWWPKKSQRCWTAAICLLETADEARKQQFAATSFIMGLVPLTLKDIAWPERRTVYVTKPLNFVVESLVLSLGLVPQITNENPSSTQSKNCENNTFATWAWKQSKGRIWVLILLSIIGVLASYAGIVVMEIYSKRSSLGCPFPAFVLMWYIAAIVPACIHAGFAVRRRHRQGRLVKKDDGELMQDFPARRGNKSDQHNLQVREHVVERGDASTQVGVSAVPGSDEEWPVQLAWAVYYIAGGLIFSSIMAVTVIELVVWVGLGFAVAGSTKLLAFFLCLVFEETKLRDKSGRSLLSQ